MKKFLLVLTSIVAGGILAGIWYAADHGDTVTDMRSHRTATSTTEAVLDGEAKIGKQRFIWYGSFFYYPDDWTAEYLLPAHRVHDLQMPGEAGFHLFKTASPDDTRFHMQAGGIHFKETCQSLRELTVTAVRCKEIEAPNEHMKTVFYTTSSHVETLSIFDSISAQLP